MKAIAQATQTNQALPVVASDVAQQDQRHPSMAISIQIHKCSARIVMSGRFDYQMRRNFRNSYVLLLDDPAVQEIWVELGKVDYLDSSALGMLLLLKERAKTVNKPVALRTSPGFVSQVLEVANFSKLFNIMHTGPENRGMSGLPPVVANDAPITT